MVAQKRLVLHRSRSVGDVSSPLKGRLVPFYTQTSTRVGDYVQSMRSNLSMSTSLQRLDKLDKNSTSCFGRLLQGHGSNYCGKTCASNSLSDLAAAFSVSNEAIHVKQKIQQARDYFFDKESTGHSDNNAKPVMSKGSSRRQCSDDDDNAELHNADCRGANGSVARKKIPRLRDIEEKSSSPSCRWDKSTAAKRASCQSHGPNQSHRAVEETRNTGNVSEAEGSRKSGDIPSKLKTDLDRRKGMPSLDVATDSVEKSQQGLVMNLVKHYDSMATSNGSVITTSHGVPSLVTRRDTSRTDVNVTSASGLVHVGDSYTFHIHNYHGTQEHNLSTWEDSLDYEVVETDDPNNTPDLHSNQGTPLTNRLSRPLSEIVYRETTV